MVQFELSDLNATEQGRAETLSLINAVLLRADDELEILAAVSVYTDADQDLPTITLSYLTVDGNDIPKSIVRVAAWREGMPWDDDPLAQKLIPIDQDLLSSLWRTNPDEVILIADTRTDPRLSDIARANLQTENILRIVLIPLHGGGTWQGLITIHWPQAKAFTGEERFIFSDIGRTAGAVVASRRAFVAQDIAHRQIESLFSVSQALIVADTFEELLQAFSGSILKEDGGCAYLILVNQSEISEATFADVVAVTGYKDAIKLPVGMRIKHDESIFSKLVLDNTNAIKAIADVQMLSTEESELVGTGATFLKDHHIQSLVAIPLRIRGGRWAGTVLITWSQPHTLSTQERSLYTVIAPQMATIVENRRLYLEQQKTAEELRAIDQLKSQFMANMSHELRTPLNAILNFTEFVANGIFGPVNEKQVDALNKAINSGDHLLSLINDILDLTKIEAGMMDLFIEEVDLNELIESILATTKGLTRNKSIDFVTNIPTQLPTLKADKRRIRQILLNLLSNAVKYTPEGRVTLKVTVSKNSVQFDVIDTGIGISEQERESVFEPFRQGQNSSNQVSSTGLGLPISRSLAEAHNGKLWMESELGKGSAFHVLLPLLAPESTKPHLNTNFPH